MRTITNRGLRPALVVALCVLAVAAGPGVALARADDAGPEPSTPATQSRCSHMTLGPALVRIGDRVTGHADHGICPDGHWSWDNFPGLEPIRGCGPTSATCVFRAVSSTGTHGNRWIQGCIDGSNSQGSWISCAYYAVLGQGFCALSGSVSPAVPGVFINVYGRGTWRTDPAGRFAIDLPCRKRYVVWPLSTVLSSNARIVRAIEFPQNTFAVVDLDGDRKADFAGSLLTTVTPPCAQASPLLISSGHAAGDQITPDPCPEQNTGPGIFSPPDKVSLNKAAAYMSLPGLAGLVGFQAAGQTVTAGGRFAFTTAGELTVTGGGEIIFASAASGAVFIGAASLSLAGAIDAVLAQHVDPFDPNYTVVATPAPLRAPRLNFHSRALNRLVGALLRNALRMSALATALDTTVNRAASAAQAGNANAQALQRGAAASYLNQLAGLTSSNVGLQRSIATALRRAHRNVVRATPKLVRALRDELRRRSGPVVTMVQALGAMGVAPTDASMWLEQYRTRRVPRRFNVAAALVNPQMLRYERATVGVLRATARRF